MNSPIRYIDRLTGEIKEEKIYGEIFLRLLYDTAFFGESLAGLIARCSWFSKFYGFLQRRSWTKKQILPFIEKYGIDTREFLSPPETYPSFDAFFSRKLKPEARPLAQGKDVLIIPADGRFLAYPNIHECDGFVVKGKKFSLEKLIGNEQVAKRYQEASLLLGRLCPTDYHRFHFPCDCIPKQAQLIPGPLYSVNPLALKKNLSILADNRRMITELDTENFGKILFIEIGATNVGSIHQTFKPCHLYKKGDEKGYFSFGGSSVALVFEHQKVAFSKDLIEASSYHIETLCLMGQPLGHKK